MFMKLRIGVIKCLKCGVVDCNISQQIFRIIHGTFHSAFIKPQMAAIGFDIRISLPLDRVKGKNKKKQESRDRKSEEGYGKNFFILKILSSYVPP